MQNIHPEAIDYLISVDKFVDFNTAQKDILNKAFIDYSSNYIISTNTGTGKTALAQLRIVDTLKKNQKVIFISPYKSIAEEKRQDFEFYNKYGWSSISSSNPNETKDSIDYSKYDLISMTYEKFDSVLNNTRFVNTWLQKVGLLVVDEAHMLSDTDRGPTLESSIIKVMTLFNKRIIILMLSAVLPNVENVAKWIKAKYGTSNWRPVDLEIGFVIHSTNNKREPKKNSMNITLEKYLDKNINSEEIFIKYGSLNEINKVIYKDNFEENLELPNLSKHKTISNNTILNSIHNNSFLYAKNETTPDIINSVYRALTYEQKTTGVNNPLWFLSELTIKDKGQVLIFTTDRASTESIATTLSFLMKNSRNFHKYITTKDIIEIEQNFISKMKIKDEKLSMTMKCGVAFHHAGLDLQKRKLVEDAYKSRKIKILLSTTTLIAGVNLPASLVIFESLSFWNGNSKQIMSKRDFLNGCGRAGRPGLENRGRALFMASSLLDAIQFIAKPIEKVESQFTLDTLVFQTLSIIKRNTDINQKFTTLTDIKNFFDHSFYQSCGFKIDIKSYLKQLLEMEMIIDYKKSSNLNATKITNEKKSQDIKNNQKINNEHVQSTNKKDISVNEIYYITKVGYETIKFYINPRTGHLIRNMIFTLEAYYSNFSFESSHSFMKINMPEKITVFSIIHTLMHAKEFQPLYKTTKLKEFEKEFAKDHYNEIMINRTMYTNENLTDDERKCMSTAMVFYDKLNMRDLEQKTIFESLYHRFGRGDLLALQENMEWLLGATSKIAQVILIHNKRALKAITDILITLSKRINSGMVKEDLLELCTLKEIGRIRSHFLSKSGINTIKQLVDPKNKWIVVNILESEQLTKRIIENAKGVK